MAQDSVRLLGLDVGEKRIGVAVAYPDGIVVRPLAAINRSSISYDTCLLYTSPSPRDGLLSRMPSSA